MKVGRKEGAARMPAVTTTTTTTILERPREQPPRWLALGAHSSLRLVRSRPFLGVLLLACVCHACGSVAHLRVGSTLQGKASWYGERHHGRRTASGESFDMRAMTAAHRALPFGTRVRVTNNTNGRTVIVRINDRGPFRSGFVIDLSRAAAARLGMIAQGVAEVVIEVVSMP
ncbi:MAG: septal ring lytic transglycosylase RlpA family protein [Pseudomonadota bacterium]